MSLQAVLFRKFRGNISQLMLFYRGSTQAALYKIISLRYIPGSFLYQLAEICFVLCITFRFALWRVFQFGRIVIPVFVFVAVAVPSRASDVVFCKL